MRLSQSILLFVASSLPFAAGQSTHGDDESDKMGPVAFMWPPDREWGAAEDNTAPCGSAQGVTNRTDFPLLNGALALIIQDDSWNVHVSISYKDDPKLNDDFELLIEPKRIDSLEPGHECYPLPSPPRDIEEGANATLQLKYLSEFDSKETETFYACADIKFVAASKFTKQIPCFNVTSDDFVAPSPSSTSSSTPSKETSNSDSVSSKGSNGLSGGGIAGVVVGIVAGLALIGLGFFLARRYQQKKRIRLHELSVRSVKWDDVGNRTASP
ncbi:conserved hypothetical protein [Uncinocarpus reesii 1704]|uniref:Copper acquisition factor BIM1-like domain-containing protein n=1 Tax=Uncinocarpus reesii (strain UAMH 1704) TaxID=336963 RepID=C4JEI8_UNCRE|nr:uncharacterized protein UREG_00827 [Uncinocarpus reesii 1704]EEP75980.1 conserved hypothetical protein [Uncinocarpus reesii 1704]